MSVNYLLNLCMRITVSTSLRAVEYSSAVLYLTYNVLSGMLSLYTTTACICNGK